MSRQLKGKKYDVTALERAVQAVNSKSMGYLKASKIYNVPRCTIFDKVHKKSAIDSRQGPHTVLSSEEEERLAKWLVDMSQIGYGRSKQELLATVKAIIKADGRKTPFKDGCPGKDWYYSFLKRHPELSLRSPRQLGKERAVIKPENILQWFRDFEVYITNYDPIILQDPSRVYNADESGFSLCPKTGHVLGLKGAKSVYNLTASDKSQITVLAGMSATAHYLRPMIVYPGQRFSKNMLEGFEDAVMGRSENGWMDSELFVQWLKTVFIPDIQIRQVKLPVILLVDGHKTHMTLEASDICRDNNIILYCLLEHASHLMQPCDLQLFGALKDTWKTALRQWQINHVGQYVTKYEFAAIFKQAWHNATKVEIAVKGFKDAGIFPLDAQAVLKTDKLQTSKLFSSSTSETGAKKENNQTVRSPQAPSSSAENETPCMQSVEESLGSQTEEAPKPQTVETQVAPDIQSEAAPDTREASSANIGGHETASGSGESPMSKFLKIPEPAKRSTSKSVKRTLLPKAITGEDFRAILLEKKRKREEEENAKEQRKLERIKKREEKEKQKKEKAEQRLMKMKERKERKAEQLKMKEVKKKIKLFKQKKRRDAEEDSCSSDSFSVHDESENELPIDTNKCFKCDGTGDDSGWIACQRCYRFFHRKCTDMQFDMLTEEEVLGFPFECLYC